MKYLKIYEEYGLSRISLGEYLNMTYGAGKDLSDIKEQRCDSKNINSLKGIEKLSNATRINIGFNYLISLEGIENLTKLIGLECYRNQIKSLKGIENLINLKALACYENELKSIDEIKDLINITYLDCGSNELENIDVVKNLINLEELFCDSNQITDLRFLEKLENLNRLDFSLNPLKYPLPFDLVEELNVSNCYNKPSMNLKELFSSYDYQRKFLKECPENAIDLKPFGFHKDIKKEFPALVRGAEWGFFDLERSSI